MSSGLLAPVYLPLDGKPPKLILHPGGDLESLVRGGASGLFAVNWMNAVSGSAPALNWLTTHQRVALFTSTLTSPNYDATTANAAYAAGNFATNEVVGTGYSAGGAGDASASGTIGTPTVSNTSGLLAFSQNAPAQWPTSTLSSVQWALIYDNSLTPKSAFVLIDFGAGYNTTGGTFSVAWSASGIFTWQVHS